MVGPLKLLLQNSKYEFEIRINWYVKVWKNIIFILSSIAGCRSRVYGLRPPLTDICTYKDIPVHFSCEEGTKKVDSFYSISKVVNDKNII